MPTPCIYCPATPAVAEVPAEAFDGDRLRYPALVCAPHAEEARAAGEIVEIRSHTS